MIAATVVAVVAVWGREMFAVSLDPDIAAVQGIRVRAISTLMAVLAAVVVVLLGVVPGAVLDFARDATQLLAR